MAAITIGKQAREILTVLDDNKILILKELFNCDDVVCGCDLAVRLRVPKNLISYHIKILRKLGYVAEVKCGKNKNYRVTQEKNKTVKQILSLMNLI